MNIIHTLKKMHSLGLQATLLIIQHRVNRTFYDKKFRFLAWRGTAHHSWEDISKSVQLSLFEDFFQNLKNYTLKYSDLFPDEAIDEKTKKYIKDGYEFLGTQAISLHTISWHEDIRLKQTGEKNIFFQAAQFYKDIEIKSGVTAALSKDIKIPWELSRFQWLYALGKIFEETTDQKYSELFVNHINNWLDNNPYLVGINWVCPMDVAIRAINWIVGFWFFKYAPSISLSFWKRFICSLYDHMIYLEHNWEIYDTRTSNHYLSDLVGYLYLTYFFKDLTGIEKKFSWCFQEIIRESEKQVFHEGTDYEGSTCYHRLVTELLYVAYRLAKHARRSIPNTFEEKLKCMFQALDWWTPVDGDLIQIGDNDSGKIIAGISKELLNQQLDRKSECGIKHFDEFGLSIMKTERVHISLRHHAYQGKQPSGHFHNDVGSFTLAIDGQPIIVDPGTYVYTPSAIWRNRFRSVQAHTTSWVSQHEPISLTDQLFFLDVPEKRGRVLRSNEELLLQTSHDLYQELGLRFHRSIKLDEAEQTVTIVDWWERTITQKKKDFKNIHLCWNFTLHSAIVPEEMKDEWKFFVNRYLVSMRCTIKLMCEQSFYSPSYGKLIPTYCLCATNTLDSAMVVTTFVYE